MKMGKSLLLYYSGPYFNWVCSRLSVSLWCSYLKRPACNLYLYIFFYLQDWSFDNQNCILLRKFLYNLTFYRTYFLKTNFKLEQSLKQSTLLILYRLVTLCLFKTNLNNFQIDFYDGNASYIRNAFSQ